MGAREETTRRRGRPSPLHSLATRTIALIALSGKLIAVGTLVALFLALLVNVVLRYAVGSGIAWAYEIHALLLPWLVGAGILIAASRGGNIAITLLPDQMGPGARRILLIGIEAIILLIALSVLESSRPILKASTFQTLSTLGIKQIWGYSALVYAFVGMSVIALLEILRLLTSEAGEDIDFGRSSLS
ncbi:TRAP transporter small permease subunit [Cereibacter johrii]|uniref:TRAP transporter small permease n=1 Tax=Cereibacter johrii TaxID=445629 RepID=UPI002B256CDB|nr:TRAP transporter small permease subunit [Cereibacter johrii]MEA5163007.1 TRAP transporter small permease subunit [Cereibacter johrii]